MIYFQLLLICSFCLYISSRSARDRQTVFFDISKIAFALSLFLFLINLTGKI